MLEGVVLLESALQQTAELRQRRVVRSPAAEALHLVAIMMHWYPALTKYYNPVTVSSYSVIRWTSVLRIPQPCNPACIVWRAPGDYYFMYSLLATDIDMLTATVMEPLWPHYMDTRPCTRVVTLFV